MKRIAVPYDIKPRETMSDEEAERELLRLCDASSLSRKEISGELFFPIVGRVFRSVIDADFRLPKDAPPSMFAAEEGFLTVLTILYSTFRFCYSDVAVDWNVEGEYVSLRLIGKRKTPLSHTVFSPTAERRISAIARASGIALAVSTHETDCKVCVVLPRMRAIPVSTYSASEDLIFKCVERALMLLPFLRK